MGKARGFGEPVKPGAKASPALLKEALTVAEANCKAGRLEQAQVLYEQILLREPELAEALHGLGVVRHLGGDHAMATALIARSIALKPDDARAHYHLGVALAAQSQWQEAAASYREAIARRSDYVSAYLNLGYVLEAEHRLAEAEVCYRQLVQRRPDEAEAHYLLGNVLRVQGQWQAALVSYEAALARKPDYVEACNNLGHILENQGRLQAAEACYRRALALDPTLARVHANLGSVLDEQGRVAEALACYRQALALDPDHAPARWHAQLCLPVLYESEPEIADWHRQFACNLEALVSSTPLDTPAARENALEAVGCHVNFYLQYQGIDDTALQKCYGELAHRVMAANYPEWAKAKPLQAREPGTKIRIGYASSYILSHSGTRWVLGWMKNHDREQFEIYCYHTGQESDWRTDEFSHWSDHFHHIPHSLEAACRQIEADRLDVLIFPDIGMDARMTQLAALRLAPVQCAAWGHPVTSGLPTVDYFFSGAAMEPQDPQQYYSEKLILLPKIGVCYSRPPKPEKPRTRADFGLTDEQTVFLSCQSLFKYLPQYDYVYAAIAERVPEARFLFVAHPSEHVTDIFRRRLERAFEARGLEATEFCLLLPRQSYTDYLSLLLMADVFLDTFDFSGGNTSLEALAFNVPLVTCPKAFMRGRLAYSMLRVLGIDETVAATEDEYIEIAVRLAQDRSWHRQVADKIAERQGRLFEDTTCVTALEAFLKQTVQSGSEVIRVDT